MRHRARLARGRGQAAPGRVPRGLACRSCMKRSERRAGGGGHRRSLPRGPGRRAKVDGKAVFVADALPGERVVMRRVAAAPEFRRGGARTGAAREPRPRTGRSARISGSAAAARCSTSRPRRSSRSSRRSCSRTSRGWAASSLRGCSTRSPGRSGAIAGARGSASSSCRGRGACWSASASGPRRTSPTCTSAACSRPRPARLMDPLATLVAGLSHRRARPAGRGRRRGRRLRAGAARAGRALRRPTSNRWRAFEIEHSVRIYLQPGGPDTRQAARRRALRRCITRCPRSACASNSSPPTSSR